MTKDIFTITVGASVSRLARARVGVDTVSAVAMHARAGVTLVDVHCGMLNKQFTALYIIYGVSVILIRGSLR